MSRVLLYSGGLDSYILAKLHQFDTLLYVDAGTGYTEREKAGLPENVTIVPFKDLVQFERHDAIIPCRNFYFVMIAANYGTEISIGATKGDLSTDKDERFAELGSVFLNHMLASRPNWIKPGEYQIRLPIKHLNKGELVKEYIDAGLDVELLIKASFSCYSPVYGSECGTCKACFRKWAALAANGYDYSYVSRNYVQEVILPQIRNGTFNRPYDEGYILKALGEV